MTKQKKRGREGKRKGGRRKGLLRGKREGVIGEREKDTKEGEGEEKYTGKKAERKENNKTK